MNIFFLSFILKNKKSHNGMTRSECLTHISHIYVLHTFTWVTWAFDCIIWSRASSHTETCVLLLMTYFTHNDCRRSCDLLLNNSRTKESEWRSRSGEWTIDHSFHIWNVEVKENWINRNQMFSQCSVVVFKSLCENRLD